MTATTDRSRKRWRLALPLAIAGLAGVAYGLAPWLLRLSVDRTAVAAGLRIEHAEIGYPGWRRVELRQVRLGPTPRIHMDRVVLRYALGGLLRGRASRVEIHGLRVSELARPSPTTASAKRLPIPLPSFEAGQALLRSALDNLRELPADHVVFEASELTVDTPAGLLDIEVRASLASRPLRLEADLHLRHPGVELAGRLVAREEAGRVEARLDLSREAAARTVSLEAVLDLEAASPSATLKVSVEGLDVPELASGLSGGLGLALEVDGPRQRLVLDPPLELSWQSLAPALLAPDSLAPLREALSERASVRIEHANGSETLASSEPASDGSLALSSAFALRIESESDARATLDGDVRVTLGRVPGEIAEVDRGQLDLRIFDWPLDAGVLELVLDLSLSGKPSALAGSLGASAHLAPLRTETLTAAAASFEATAGLALRDGQLTVELERCAITSLRDALLQGRARLTALQLPVCEAEPREPVLTLGLDPAREMRARFVVESAGFVGTIETDEPEPLAYEGTTPRLRLRAESVSEDVLSGTLETVGGELRVPTLGLRLAELTTDLSFERNRARWTATGSSKLESIRHEQVVPTLVAIAELELAGQRADVRARLRDDEEGVLMLDAVATHDIASGAGEVTIELEDLLFEEGGLQPGDLLYALAGAEGIGAISAGGEARWSDEAPLASALDLGFDFPVLVVSNFPTRGLAGAIHFDSLAPLSTPPGQQIRLQDAYAGVWLTDGRADFQIMPPDAAAGADAGTEAETAEGIAGTEEAKGATDATEAGATKEAGWLAIDELVVGIAQGSVRGAGSLPLERALRAGTAFLLEVEDVQIGSLLEQLDVPGLSGAGILEGSIPGRIDSDGWWIDEGEMHAHGPERWVRYVPPVAAQAFGPATPEPGAIELLLAALENFQYDTLQVTTDGDVRGDLTFGIHLAGRNPQLHDGLPFELNIPITMPLGSLLKSMAAMYMSERSLGELRP